uniref:Gamma interferon inducible lysosomal thiol reductase n=1 Tax=Steinernema glaseri TaxID=37863 RepID=A0A1I7ZPV3_9BILA
MNNRFHFQGALKRLPANRLLYSLTEMGRLSSEKEPLFILRRAAGRHTMRQYLYGALTLLVLYLMIRWVTNPQARRPFVDPQRRTFGLTEQQNVIDTNVNTGNNVNLAVYMESQCPDTTRFIHKQLTPTWKLLSSTQRIDLTVVPFGKARCEPDGDDFKCQCQHGENECLLNQLMNCVIDQFGFPDKYIPVIDCIQGKPNLQIALKHCVDSNSLLSSDRMRTCAEGERGRRLLALAGQQTASLHPSLTFVPWITIDGKRVNDALYDLRENLCKRLDPMPEECNVTA